MSAKKALIAMSGGVDSSVCALLMKNKGFDCIGITLRLCNKNILNSSCCTDEDINDAKTVAENLNMEHMVINYESNFKEDVLDRFVSAYETGATPNPCIDCNRFIKFKGMYECALEMDADFIVTGHYARVEYNDKTGRYLLKKGVDESKDQSYVLYSLSQEQLSKTIFPLGHMPKSEVRQIALYNGFLVANKKDSQDLCFVPDGNYTDFIKQYTGKEYPCGDFVDTEGNFLGKHKGIIGYTIGQRKGLGLSLPRPMFVCNKDIDSNKVVLTEGKELYNDTLFAHDLNLISVSGIEKPMKVKAKVRYNQKEQPATVEQISDYEIKVKFDEPQRAITSGQAVVLYDGDIVVGGATIK